MCLAQSTNQASAVDMKKKKSDSPKLQPPPNSTGKQRSEAPRACGLLLSLVVHSEAAIALPLMPCGACASSASRSTRKKTSWDFSWYDQMVTMHWFGHENASPILAEIVPVNFCYLSTVVGNAHATQTPQTSAHGQCRVRAMISTEVYAPTTHQPIIKKLKLVQQLFALWLPALLLPTLGLLSRLTLR